MNKYEWLDGFLKAMAGCEKDYKPEWDWWRYRVGERMFAAVCKPGTEHAQYGGRELVTLKCEPMLAEELRKQYADVIPGFYMDKRCWNSVYLDGELPDEELKAMCRQSYELVFQRLTKKLQKEITENASRAQ